MGEINQVFKEILSVAGDVKKFETGVLSMERFLNEVDPKDIKTMFKLSYHELESVLVYFQDSEIEKICPNYREIAGILLGVIDIHEKEGRSYKELDCVSIEDEGFLYEVAAFLDFLKDQCALNIDQEKEKLRLAKALVGYFKRMTKDFHTEGVIFDRDVVLNCARTLDQMDAEFANMFLSLLLDYNKSVLDQMKEKAKEKRIYSKEELERSKKEKYQELYSLDIPDTVSLEKIEEVLKSSRDIGLSFLTQHPEVFQEKKDDYLRNIAIFNRLEIPLPLIIERDPEALLLSKESNVLSLEQRLSLIGEYHIDIKELLLYQPKAITDLSYFHLLDLMIEHGMFDLKQLKDQNHVALKKKICLDLLGLDIPVMTSFPLSEEETMEFLSLNQVNKIEETYEGSLDKSLLDYQFMVDARTYQFDGILISRPKYLRLAYPNQENMLEVLLANSYFTLEEVQRVSEIVKPFVGGEMPYQKQK